MADAKGKTKGRRTKASIKSPIVSQSTKNSCLTPSTSLKANPDAVTRRTSYSVGKLVVTSQMVENGSDSKTTLNKTTYARPRSKSLEGSSSRPVGGYVATTVRDSGTSGTRPKRRDQELKQPSYDLTKSFAPHRTKPADSKTMQRPNRTVTATKIQPATRDTENSPNLTQNNYSLTIVIMNANGPGTAEERRKGIADVVKKLRPKLVLFQEFKWVGICGKIWQDNPLPSHHQYFGNQEASLLYDIRDIVAEELNSTNLMRILEQLQRTSNNALGRPFPTDFDPLSRMCASRISTIGVPFWEFICISWHGPWSRYTLDKRKSYFQYFLEFLRNIKQRFKRPLLVAGDFNIDLPDVIAFIKRPFKKYEYTPSERREGSVKDFFITTEDMDLSNIAFVETGGYKAFDHDPVTSCLRAVRADEKPVARASSVKPFKSGRPV